MSPPQRPSQRPAAPRRGGTARERRERQRQETAGRRAEQEDEARRRVRRRTWTVASVVTAVALGVAALVAVISAGGSSSPQHVETVPFTPASESGLSTATPPWPLPPDATADIENGGLNPYGSEATAVHYHVHLDIVVNGSPVQVPAHVGFVIHGSRATGLSFIHTHDASGIIHIESLTNDAYTLGQFFTEWGVAVGPGHLGGLVSDGSNMLRVFVNGRRFAGNPADLVFKAHQEITLWFGPRGATPHVPAAYTFPAGL